MTRLCDADAARLAEVAARHGGIATTTRAEDVLDDPDIDVVSIATYDDAHAAQVLRALERGKHVFVEKPLCQHAAEARRIRAALEARPELRLSSNLILRRSPRFAAVREMIRAGDLGEIYHVQGDYQYGRLHKLTEGWRGRRPYYSVVHGGAVHMVDLLLWLTGRRVAEVAAFGTGIATRGSGFRFDDTVTAVLRYHGGMTGQVTANFACVRPHGHDLAVYGTAATVLNGPAGGVLYTSRDPAALPVPLDEPHPGAAKGDLLGRFVESILGGAEPEVPAADVLHVAAVCLAIERARLEGTAVAVEDVWDETRELQGRMS